MTLESKAAFARRLGVNKSTITRAAQAGRLALVGEMVEVEQSIARWHATQGGRADVAERHAMQRGQAIPENAVAGPRGPFPGLLADALAAQAQADADGGHGAADRTAWKALTLGYENDLIKLEMALRRHRRYPLAAVRREAQALGATLRASVERLIDQTAPRLAATPAAAGREALLRAECAALAGAFGAECKRALRRLRRGTN